MNTINKTFDKDIVSTSVEETFRIAEEFTNTLNPGDIICLTGDLGAGKTHFVKGVAKAMELDPSVVSSPTFTLIHEYKGGNVPLYHFDFYRLKSELEALDIGAEEYFYDDGVCFIEWPEKVPGIIPDEALWIQFKHISKNKRRIKFTKKVE